MSTAFVLGQYVISVADISLCLLLLQCLHIVSDNDVLRKKVATQPKVMPMLLRYLSPPETVVPPGPQRMVLRFDHFLNGEAESVVAIVTMMLGLTRSRTKGCG